MKNGCREEAFMIMPLSKIQRCVLVYVCALCTQICVRAWLCRNNEEEEERWMFLYNLIQICIIDLDQSSNLGTAQSKSTWQADGNSASSTSPKWKIRNSFGSYMVNSGKSHVKVESHLCMLNWGSGRRACGAICQEWWRNPMGCHTWLFKHRKFTFDWCQEIVYVYVLKYQPNTCKSLDSERGRRIVQPSEGFLDLAHSLCKPVKSWILMLFYTAAK